MNVVNRADAAAAQVAAAIGEPARARMLFSLMDGRARTSTELAALADVGAPTASAHLQRLRAAGLVVVRTQGKHRFYTIANTRVGAALEALTVLAGGARGSYVPAVPSRLRAARSCYDHLAGALGVALHDRWLTLDWIHIDGATVNHAYLPTPAGAAALAALGVDAAELRTQRRRFAFACLDWSERRPHLGGALGAALFHLALERGWFRRELDSRALLVTARGRRELEHRFGLTVTT